MSKKEKYNLDNYKKGLEIAAKNAKIVIIGRVKMIYFQKVTNNNTIKGLSQSAIEIFKEHYYPILGVNQVEYMVGLFHTPSAIKEQMRNGALFYLVYSNTIIIGFFAVERHGNKTFLSKFYLNKDYRGNGTGKRMMNKVFEVARNYNSLAVYLNVNKENDDSLYFYLHEGFEEIGQVKEDIGNGYYMDDYILYKKVEQKENKQEGEKKDASSKKRIIKGHQETRGQTSSKGRKESDKAGA